MNDDDTRNSTDEPPAPRPPTIQEVLSGRENIAIQHMHIALSLAQAPIANPQEVSVGRIPGWRYPPIRAHLRAALEMLFESEND